MHPGMLSAALQGNPPPQHPPTPPRTPQDMKLHGMPPKMPSLLSNAFIQQHMKPGMPPALPAHINKMGLQGKHIFLSPQITRNRRVSQQTFRKINLLRCINLSDLNSPSLPRWRNLTAPRKNSLSKFADNIIRIAGDSIAQFCTAASQWITQPFRIWSSAPL